MKIELLASKSKCKKTDDFAPNGNDTGADVLHCFKDNTSKISKSKDGGKAVLTRKWQNMWSEAIPEATDNYDDLALNDYREFVIGFAFAFLKYLARCPDWLKVEALHHIEKHQAFIKRESPNWEHLDALKHMNTLMIACLEKAANQHHSCLLF